LDDFWRETVGKVARKLRRSDVRQGNVKGKRREEGRAQVVNGGEVRGDEEEQEWVWGEKERLKAYGDAVEVLVQLARILVVSLVPLLVLTSSWAAAADLVRSSADETLSIPSLVSSPARPGPAYSPTRLLSSPSRPVWVDPRRPRPVPVHRPAAKL
jgi:hypothetical protein